MIFHLLLNSFSVFIILTLLIELFLSVFKITNARLRYLLRLLPVLKFPFDLLVFVLFDENLFINFNPLSCQVYMQDLITNFVHLHIQNELAPTEHFIIPKYLASYIPPNFLNITIMSMLGVSLLIITRKVYLFFRSRSCLKKIFVSSSLCDRPIYNSNLMNKLKQGNIRIRISDAIHIPFAAGLRYIFMPQQLVTELSQEEFESVVVHELEHLRWKDPILKMACELLCALFWWLPSAWWLKRLELEQEDACDVEVHKYGIDVSALATAMIKVVKKAKYQSYQFAAISSFDSPKNSHVRRVENILNIKNKSNYSWHYTFGIGACLLATLCFWMC
jgi:beta-lactamase regulating signal transducer with metallopeptidase domain